MGKEFRRITAGLQLILLGWWLPWAIGGRPAFNDFLGQLKEYIETGVADTSWVRKYTQ